MKRLNTLALLLVIAVFTLVSANIHADDTDSVTTTRPGFVDEDGDGVCDNAGSGLGKGWGGGSHGAGFIDEDGDGVCDNAGSGLGKGMGRGSRGAGFIDEDGDGVCDNYTGTKGAGKKSAGASKSLGRHRGRHLRLTNPSAGIATTK